MPAYILWEARAGSRQRGQEPRANMAWASRSHTHLWPQGSSAKSAGASMHTTHSACSRSCRSRRSCAASAAISAPYASCSSILSAAKVGRSPARASQHCVINRHTQSPHLNGRSGRPPASTLQHPSHSVCVSCIHNIYVYVSDIVYHCICAVLRYVCMEWFLIGRSITVYSVRIGSVRVPGIWISMGTASTGFGS